MNKDKRQLLDHSGKILFGVAIAAMVICYIYSFILSLDSLGFLALAILAVSIFAIWLCIALVGCITFTIFMPGYRAFLGKFGKFIIDIFNPDLTMDIKAFVTKLSVGFPYVAVIAGIVLIASITCITIARSNKWKSKTIALSILGILYVISVIISSSMMGRIGGVA